MTEMEEKENGSIEPDVEVDGDIGWHHTFSDGSTNSYYTERFPFPSIIKNRKCDSMGGSNGQST